MIVPQYSWAFTTEARELADSVTLFPSVSPAWKMLGIDRHRQTLTIVGVR
jgi:hypothetical protein